MSVMLTEEDVDRLRREVSDQARSDAAEKIASVYGDGALSAAERAIAEDIFYAMAHDVAVQVRRTLSQQLKLCPFLPRSIALTLARDVDSVAIPVLESSLVLTDDDIVDIVRAGSVGKQLAVARRDTVSERVSEVLVDNGEEQVVATLLANQGAAISDATMIRVVDDFGHREMVQRRMVRRAHLPVTVIERLAAIVSEDLKHFLVTEHDLPAVLAENVIAQTRESVVARAMPEVADLTEIRDLVQQLHREKRLTPTLLLRALCNGEVDFFEAACAALTGRDLGACRRLIRGTSQQDFRALYRRAGLPEPLYPAFRVALAVIVRSQPAGAEVQSPDARVRAIMDELAARYPDVEPGELETVLSRLYQRVAGYAPISGSAVDA